MLMRSHYLKRERASCNEKRSYGQFDKSFSMLMKSFSFFDKTDLFNQTMKRLNEAKADLPSVEACSSILF